MPLISQDIPDHQDYIQRPIVMEIANQIMRFAKLRTDEVIFRGLASQPKQAGSTMDEPDKVSSFSNARKVTITAEEDFVPDSLLTTGILQRSKRTVFYDAESGVYIAPVRKDATIEIEFTYNASSAAECRDWRNRMQQYLERRMEILTHKLAYTYPIPVEQVASLKHIHALREKGSQPYGQTLPEYLKEKFSTNVTVRSQVAGGRSQFVVEETQHDIQGTFLFDEVPKSSKDETVHQISFTYRINYEKPYAMVMEYPLVVNNHLVSSDLLPNLNVNEQLELDRSVVRGWFDGVIEVTEPTQARVGGYSIPDSDTWKVPHPPRDTGSIFRILITVDESDPTLILNINELGKYRLNEDIVEMMRQAGNMLFEYAHCPVLVQFYENDRNVNAKDLEFDGTELRVRNRTLNPRNSYHLRIALITNLAMLSEPAIDLALQHGRATRSILLALEPTLIAEGLMPPLRNGSIEDHAYRKAMDYVRYTSPSYHLGGELRIRVAFVTISAQRS